MPYANTPIQSSYQRYFNAGFIGQVALLQNGNFFFDQAENAVELKPGYGVYLDTSGGATNGQWLLPAPGSEDLVTHIVSYDPSDTSQPLAVPVGNQTSEIVYPANTPLVKAMAEGAIYVQLGTTTVERGQAVQFDATNNNYILNTLATPALQIVALDAGTNDDIIAVRINRVNATP